MGESAEFFYKNGDYGWMSEKVEAYDVILEIGCGTGYSTLSLIEGGHKVIENNEFCLDRTKELLKVKGYTYGEEKDDFSKYDVMLLKRDICEHNLADRLTKYKIRAIVCWNTGSYWSKEMLTKYIPTMLEYGLTLTQIQENPGSSYSELVQWRTCRLAAELNACVHIIDRNTFATTEKNDDYFILFKDEFNFKDINYDYKETISKSGGGRALLESGKIRNENTITIILISIMYSR